MVCFQKNKDLFTLGVIPARYASTRFPGKPLADINGMSMIERVYKRALNSNMLNDVCIATDDNLIFTHATQFGANVFMTSDKHQSGTDRCLEATNKYMELFPNKKVDIVVNIQGDEPLIQAEVIDELISAFQNTQTQIATMITPIKNKRDIDNNNIVKVVFNKKFDALYFSRLPIPFIRNSENTEHTYYKHLGLYAYRSETLNTICSLPISLLEKTESLEQLRWLENAIPIRVAITKHDSICVDVPEDIQRIKDILKENNIN